MAFDQSGLRWLGISDLIAEPEGPTFISYKVARRRLDRLRFVTQDPVRNSGTSIVLPSRHPACAGRGRRMTTAINMFAMGFGVVTPRPGLSLRYLATERSPCVKLTDDNDNWSSRPSLVVKKGRSATTRLCGSEERFITLSQFGSIEKVAAEAPFTHRPIVSEATLVRRNHSAASASREASCAR